MSENKVIFKYGNFLLKRWLLVCVFLIHTLLAQGQPPSIINNLELEYYQLPVKDSTYIDSLLKRAMEMFMVKSDSTLILFEEVRQLSLAANYNYGIVDAMLRTALFHVIAGDNNKASQVLEQTRPYLQKSNNPRLQIYWNKTLSNMFSQLGAYDSSLFYIRKGLAITTSIKDTSNMVLLYVDEATTWMTAKEFEKALGKLQVAEQISLKSYMHYHLTYIYINYAILYSKTGGSARLYYYANKASELATKMGNRREQRQAMLLLADYARMVGDYKLAIRYDKAALTLGDSSHRFAALDPEYGLSISYFKLKNYQKAGAHGLKALATYDGSDEYTHARASLYQHLARVYYWLDKYKEAFEYQEIYSRMADTLNHIERVRSANRLEVQYRTAEKDKALTRQQLELNEKATKLRISRILMISGGMISLLLLISLFLLRRNARNRQRNLQQHAAIQALEAALEGEQKERNRIAMELHDGIVSKLTVIKLNFEMARPVPGYTAAYEENINQFGVAITDISSTAHNLMPEILTYHQLDKAIELLCNLIEKTGKLEIEYFSYGDFAEINPDLGKTLYRIVQELLHNIIKHANADQAAVQISCYNRLLSITVEDNGVGWNTVNRKGEGMGLNSIRQRIDALNGSIKFDESGFGSGLGVHIELDIN